MKIPAITTALNYSNKFGQPKKTEKNNIPSFKAVDIAKLKKMPLEDKLTHLFTTVSPQDLIVVGKSVPEIQMGLKKAITVFDNVIKRIFFVLQGRLAVPLAFSADSDDTDIMCTNIGENTIIHSNFDTTDDLAPNDSCIIRDGDVLINKNVNIPIQVLADFAEHEADFDDMQILLSPENYATKVFDFESEQQDMVQKINEESLRLLTKTDKKEKVKDKSKLSFNDIGGLEDAITKLKKGIIYPIEFPYAYQNRKNLNHGFILYGPPGTGKTLLAQAVAGEVDAHYIKLNGLEMESKWVGESNENWRKLFADAKKNQPAVIFLDEFDAVARNRSGQDIHGDKVVNQILTLMKDIDNENLKVFVIAATNKLEMLDNAIVRSGRFGEYINIAEPDRSSLDKIFEVHARDKNIDPNFNNTAILDKCHQMKMTGADIAFIINKAQDASWERCGIYEKMESRSLTKADIENATIKEVDFNKALDDMLKSRTKQTRNPIGYNR